MNVPELSPGDKQLAVLCSSGMNLGLSTVGLMTVPQLWRAVGQEARGCGASTEFMGRLCETLAKAEGAAESRDRLRLMAVCG